MRKAASLTRPFFLFPHLREVRTRKRCDQVVVQTVVLYITQSD